MENAKKLGIWMDHSSAHLIEFKQLRVDAMIIKSKFTYQEKENKLRISEGLMHNKEKKLQSEYYKNISEEILKYGNIVLFGPTNAKTELLNLLRDDHRFDKIQIEVESTDKMTDNQKHAFVKNYFSPRLSHISE